MRNRLAAVLLLSACSSVWAQTDSASVQPSWFLSLHSGVLIGRPGIGTTVSTAIMPGIRLHRLSLGVGMGYDTYDDWQTLPVFAGVSYDVIKRESHSFFVQLNTGYSRAWIRDGSENQLTYENEGGFFYHPLLGYRVHHGKFTVYFSAGYKVQRLTYEEFPQWWTMTSPSGMKRTVVRDMERGSISIGVGLW